MNDTLVQRTKDEFTASVIFKILNNAPCSVSWKHLEWIKWEKCLRLIGIYGAQTKPSCKTDTKDIVKMTAKYFCS